MNRMSTDEIVDHLTGELKPVKRTTPPILGTALWLAASTAFIGALVWHHGMRPDIGRLLDDAGYRTLFAACVATAALGALATFMVSLPDARYAGLCCQCRGWCSGLPARASAATRIG